jgi:hypothetical protein
MHGTISSIEEHGSVVILWLDTNDDESQPAYMDRRAFGWMIDGEGIESPDELIGRSVCYDGETIEFLDNVEVA